MMAIVDTYTNTFCTKKIGQFGEKFNIYKLRTIQIDQEEKRISKAGQFLRKYKLDNCRRCLMF
jgi:lipopolysaccharide/colanic/teichoic acid biosynthesis glycosyltransferase